MKIELIFGRTGYDELTAWVDIQEVKVDVPDWLLEKPNDWHAPQYHLIGAVMPDESNGESNGRK